MWSTILSHWKWNHSSHASHPIISYSPWDASQARHNQIASSSLGVDPADLRWPLWVTSQNNWFQPVHWKKEKVLWDMCLKEWTNTWPSPYLTRANLTKPSLPGMSSIIVLNIQKNHGFRGLLIRIISFFRRRFWNATLDRPGDLHLRSRRT